MKTKDTEMLRR